MKVLSAVYNSINYDGRVQRACSALCEIADVTLICPKENPIEENFPFNIQEIDLPGKEARFKRHLIFWMSILTNVRKYGPDIIYVHDYYLCLPGVIAKWIFRCRCIYDAHELIIPDPGTGKNHYRFWYYLEKMLVKKMDSVIAANSERAQIMSEYYGISLPVVIRNIPPQPKAFDALPDTVAKIVHQCKREKMLVYQGELAPNRGIEKFIMALAYLDQNIGLLIIGGGIAESYLINCAKEVGVEDRVIFLGRVPRHLLPTLLNQCDAGVVTYPNSNLNNIYCASNKVFEYAQSGLPVVSTDQPPLRHLLREYDIGGFVSATAPGEAVAMVVRDVLSRPRDILRRNLKEFLDAHCWESEAHKLRAHFQSW